VHLTRRVLLFAVVLLLVACSSASATRPATSAKSLAPTPTDRLPAAEATALIQLADRSQPIDTSVTHDHQTVTLASTLPPADQARFDAEIQAAVDAAKAFATTDAAAAAGYVQSSLQLPAIGTHWIKWSLVDAPFDPAHPSMLLFDESTLHPTRLAGLSYWVRSDNAPEGFTGPNDVWHRHSGLCFENGWLARENVPSSDECAGQWLNGSDLWMLHVWVAPDVTNTAGLFAARNESLCPPDRQQLPDLLKCNADGTGDGHGDTTIVVPADGVYCHLPST
jgi:hypothetical protein